ncbi:MAG: hypothetical protein ACRDY7_14875, partial [Acidimicrobiia bacterium]
MATGSHTRYETGKPAGLAAGAAALGVSELAAGAMPHTPSLIESVGDAVVDVLPAPLIEFGISVFGSMDKIVFVGLMLVICAAAAAALGAVAVRRWPLAASGFALFGAFGVAAALRDPQTSTATVALSAGLSVAAGLATLTALLRLGAPGPLRRAALPALPGDGPASPSP